MTSPAEQEPIEGLMPTLRWATRSISESIRTEPLVPPRCAKLSNRIVATSGGAKLIQPDGEAVADAVASVKKLKYFGVGDTEAFLSSKFSSMADYEYARLVFEPLLEQVKLDHPGKQLLTFRGGMASVNGTLTYEFGHSTTILDVADIVRKGGDREVRFNAATTEMDIPVSEMTMYLDRVNQYAAGTGFQRYSISTDAPEVAESLFPVVSVYDSSMLQKAGGNVWAVVPKEGLTASDALLTTYILDCPTR